MTKAAARKLDSVQATPPETLYYGTDSDGMRTVLMEGLAADLPLHADLSDARSGGADVVFAVFAQAAHAEGQAFSQVLDGSWRTGALEVDYLYLPPVRGEE
ncbi:hypothetical protein [Pseudoprimorskyibacter insulae]|uniref:Uncharacterized protein n=1 Tax=Pseudoprimorskyibacter insulae TaxID=1695997 RepID=A0A2R8AUZ0_9RHOB|nr:hypothetical protein [Pseudoprimorskyibacter insulae]SPF79704.1 hypothetical protein PRI8871_01501 [Pseudoprimorskyibacter insulae]